MKIDGLRRRMVLRAVEMKEGLRICVDGTEYPPRRACDCGAGPAITGLPVQGTGKKNFKHLT